MDTNQIEIKAIQVSKSETFHIHLWEDRTRGEQWVPTYDPKVLALVEDDFLRTVSNNAVDPGAAPLSFSHWPLECIAWNLVSGWPGNSPLKIDVCSR